MQHGRRNAQHQGRAQTCRAVGVAQHLHTPASESGSDASAHSRGAGSTPTATSTATPPCASSARAR